MIRNVQESQQDVKSDKSKVDVLSRGKLTKIAADGRTYSRSLDELLGSVFLKAKILCRVARVHWREISRNPQTSCGKSKELKQLFSQIDSSFST